MKNFSNQHKKYFSKKAFVSLVRPLNNTKFLPRLMNMVKENMKKIC